MIEHLRGTLITREEGHVVIECGGVGYGLDVSRTTLSQLPAEGAEAQIFVHTQMRESEIALCGFATGTERALFRTLLGVPSIGPKVALVILSTLAPDELAQAVLTEDLPVLTSVSGIGAKTAKRMVVELREAMRKIPLDGAPMLELEESALVPGLTREMRDAAVNALIQLGTKPVVAARAVGRAAKALTEEPSVELLVKEGLKHR